MHSAVKDGMNREVFADHQVTSLRSAMHHGGTSLGSVPALLKVILREELWRRRIVKQTQKPVEFDSFAEFVTAKAPEGLGTTVKALLQFCQTGGDLEAVDEIDKATAGKRGVSRSNVSNRNISLPRPVGTMAASAIRVLRRKRPDLHERVLAGELSPNAAMLEAGLRSKSHTIPHDVERAAAAIKRHFSEAEVKEIVSLLHRADD